MSRFLVAGLWFLVSSLWFLVLVFYFSNRARNQKPQTRNHKLQTRNHKPETIIGRRSDESSVDRPALWRANPAQEAWLHSDCGGHARVGHRREHDYLQFRECGPAA